ncbi:hypothetical protein GWK47_035328 [Chionoecetes opilio]|uniref:Uncharacterized protein n=1 Tax=Chionoecetes opilio TaxID=41210 RepID=A0A8J4YQF0_CHIOP|nr:hypothetical protein GWK47_035328 [Chionoecetes opilio]
MSSSKHIKPSRELRRALKGALAMARDRGYVMSGDNPLLTPPPRDSKTFFRSFPAHFDVTDRLGQQVVRFEFWNKPLIQLPGRECQRVAKRVRRAARRTGVPLARVRLVLLVPHYTHQQERRERRALKGLSAHLEVIAHQFFFRVSELPSPLPWDLLADRIFVERFHNVYGHVGDLTKVSSEDSCAATWAPSTGTSWCPVAGRGAWAPSCWWSPPDATVTTTPGRQSGAWPSGVTPERASTVTWRPSERTLITIEAVVGVTASPRRCYLRIKIE